MCGTCQAGLLIALFVGRPLNRGLADVVLLVPFLYASVQTLAPCTAHSSLHLRRVYPTSARQFRAQCCSFWNTLNTVPFCCSQLGTASAAKSNHPTTSHLPQANLRLPLRGSPRPCGAPRRRRGRRLAPGPRPAPPRPTTDRPAAPAQAFLRPRSKRRVGCGLLPCPATRRPLAGRLTAHGSLACSPRACPRAATLAPSPDAHPAQTALRDRRSSDR